MQGSDHSAESRIRQLVSQLADYSTRSRARTQLVMIGRPAVGALAEALESPIEGIAWSAAKTLSEIGGEEAVGPLTQAMANPALREVAAEGLRRITGKAPGTSGGAAESAEPETAAAKLGDEQLAKSLVWGEVAVQKTQAGYAYTVHLPGGRRQKVDMLLSLKDSDGSRLVAFYTECGAARPDRYEWALKTNLKIPFGAFALRETSSGPRFVMVDAYLRDTAGVQQLRRALETVAKRADAFEETLSGKDEV